MTETASPARILHIVGRMDRAGAETLLMNLYRAIDRDRFQFDFVYFTADACAFDDEIEALGGRIVRIGAGNALSRCLALWRVLRRGGWGTVHAHTLCSIGLHLLAARLAGVPQRVAHSHNTADDNSHALLGRAYQRAMIKLIGWTATCRVACGKAAAAYLFPGRSDVVVIPNAIAIERFTGASGAACRSALGVEPDCLLILHAARLMPVKNHLRSVRIALALLDAGVDFRMAFVGDGAERDAVAAAIEAAGLEHRILLAGVQANVAEWMAAADVMLMPSLYEGFPVVLVESQAAGLPAVISAGISPEVDLGLGLVQPVDLARSDADWAECLIHAASAAPVAEADRRQVLEARGFSDQSGVQMLTRIYEAP